MFVKVDSTLASHLLPSMVPTEFLLAGRSIKQTNKRWRVWQATGSQTPH